MLTCITFVSYFIFLSLFSLLILLLSLSFLPFTKPTKPNFFKTNLSKIVNWRVISNDHIRKQIVWWLDVSRGNYAIYGYLLSNVKIKWRISPTTKICWNPLLIPCLFPESNLYCAQLPLNLILHPNDNGNNSDLWFRWWLEP